MSIKQDSEMGLFLIFKEFSTTLKIDTQSLPF
jgi:hypothetical protein